MKTLEFDAVGQDLKLVGPVKVKRGSKGGYLRARFHLDEEYDGADVVIASFGNSKGQDEVAVELDGSMECPFPDEVTDLPVIGVWLTCRTGDGAVFQTSRAMVPQRR